MNVTAYQRYYDVDGAKVPRVTAMLEAAGLINTRWFTDEARDRGTRIHLATKLLDEGKLAWSGLTEEERPYVEAWAKFKEELGVIVKEREVFLCDPQKRYAGTCDAIASADRGTSSAPPLWVLDLKAGAELPSYRIQTAAYEDMLHATRHVAYYRRAAVHLLPDGKYRFRPHTRMQDYDDWAAVARVIHLRLNHGLWKLDD